MNNRQLSWTRNTIITILLLPVGHISNIMHYSWGSYPIFYKTLILWSLSSVCWWKASCFFLKLCAIMKLCRGLGFVWNHSLFWEFDIFLFACINGYLIPWCIFQFISSKCWFIHLVSFLFISNKNLIRGILEVEVLVLFNLLFIRIDIAVWDKLYGLYMAYIYQIIRVIPKNYMAYTQKFFLIFFLHIRNYSLIQKKYKYASGPISTQQKKVNYEILRICNVKFKQE